jgi:four helix bundle protein
MPVLESYKKLEVWKQAMRLAEEVYKNSESIPDPSLRGLLRRAAFTVPSKIAEGAMWGNAPEYTSLLAEARASLFELQTLIELATRLRFFSAEQRDSFDTRIRPLAWLLRGLKISVTDRHEWAQVNVP